MAMMSCLRPETNLFAHTFVFVCAHAHTCANTDLAAGQLLSIYRHMRARAAAGAAEGMAKA